MLKKEDFKVGDSVKVVSLTTTVVGDAVDSIFIGNTGKIIGINEHEDEHEDEFNDQEFLFDNTDDSWYVSSCDLEIVNG